jgi:histidine triad (HIT) family protein
MTQNCIFCDIIDGKKPGTTVYRDEDVVAFLDINPASPIHILIVPRNHIPSINDMQDDQETLIGHMFTVANYLAIENGISESGYRLIINSGPDAKQAVFHLHLHLLGGREMRFQMG